jgi:hypothetical protein
LRSGEPPHGPQDELHAGVVGSGSIVRRQRKHSERQRRGASLRVDLGAEPRGLVERDVEVVPLVLG